MVETTVVEARGVKELSEALVFAISIGEAFDLALADKKLGIEDLGLLVVPFTKAPNAVEGLDQIGAEIKDHLPRGFGLRLQPDHDHRHRRRWRARSGLRRSRRRRARGEAEGPLQPRFPLAEGPR